GAPRGGRARFGESGRPCGLARGRTFRRPAAERLGARVEQPHGFVERDRLRRLVARQGRVDTVVADVGAVAAVLRRHRAALYRMLAERPAGVGTEAAPALALELLVRNQRHRAVEPDGEHVVARLEACVAFAVLHIGAEAADAGEDGLAVFRVAPDLARAREQAERA